MDLRESNLGISNRHPWELARLQTILGLVKDQKVQGSVLDIGSGDCYIAEYFANSLHMEITAVDAEYKTNGTENNVEKFKNLADVPKFDYSLVLMLDVIEHVENDVALIEAATAHLRPGGLVFITVPAFQFLFSGHDTFLGHFRRYNRQQLSSVVAKSRLKEKEIFYFFFSLYFARMATKLFSRFKANSENSELAAWPFSQSSLVTRFITGILSLDSKVCKFLSTNLHIPIPGLSICIIAQKKSS